jgi:hypothetical protein
MEAEASVTKWGYRTALALLLFQISRLYNTLHSHPPVKSALKSRHCFFYPKKPMAQETPWRKEKSG